VEFKKGFIRCDWGSIACALNNLGRWGGWMVKRRIASLPNGTSVTKYYFNRETRSQRPMVT
jgi:hypothetical protein